MKLIHPHSLTIKVQNNPPTTTVIIENKKKKKKGWGRFFAIQLTLKELKKMTTI